MATISRRIEIRRSRVAETKRMLFLFQNMSSVFMWNVYFELFLFKKWTSWFMIIQHLIWILDIPTSENLENPQLDFCQNGFFDFCQNGFKIEKIQNVRRNVWKQRKSIKNREISDKKWKLARYAGLFECGGYLEFLISGQLFPKNSVFVVFL